MVSNPKGEPFVQEARVGPAAQPSEVTWDGRKVTTGYLMMMMMMMVYNTRLHLLLFSGSACDSVDMGVVFLLALCIVSFQVVQAAQAGNADGFDGGWGQSKHLNHLESYLEINFGSTILVKQS